MLDQVRNLPHSRRARIAAGTLAAAAVIGSASYPHYAFGLFWRYSSFIPNLASGIVAFFLILPLLRGKLLHSPRLDLMTSLSLLLLFYLVSIIVKMGLQGSSLIGMATQSPVFILVVAANFNAHKYGEIALLCVIVIGGFNIFSVSQVMGFWGWAFIGLFAIGALLTLDLSKLYPRDATRGRGS